MKNILKLSLAVMAIAALAACGGGGSDEPADKYVGNWKSSCYESVSTSGTTFFYVNTYSVTKTSAGEVLFTGTYAAHSDGKCANSAGSGGLNGAQMNIGAETTFLGAKSDSIVRTNLVTGEALPGYATSDGNKMYLRTYTPGTSPTNWGSASPFSKI